MLNMELPVQSFVPIHLLPIKFTLIKAKFELIIFDQKQLDTRGILGLSFV